MTTALAVGVPGDLVETGVWRGGAAINLRALLAALGDTERTVSACDSFEGLPEADGERFPMDVPMRFHEHRERAVGVDAVRLARVLASPPHLSSSGSRW